MLDKLQALIERVADEPDEVARLAGMPVERIQEALAGSLDRWTTSMVERLARAARLDPAVVWSSAPLPAVPTLRFLRSAWPDFDDRDTPVLLDALEDAAAMRALAVDRLGHERLFSDADRIPVHEPAWRQGYGLARRVRERVGNLDTCIDDVESLVAERLHVLVVRRPVVSLRVDAVTLMSPEGSAIVLADGVRSPVMARRSIAHQLAHALFDPYEGNLHTVVEDVLQPDGDSSPYEQRARAFAAELLVPLQGLERVLGVPTRSPRLDVAHEAVRTVAREFQAPTELVAYHLINHGFVDEGIKLPLVDAVRGQEPFAEAPTRNWLQVRVREALEADCISEGRALEILRYAVERRDLVA